VAKAELTLGYGVGVTLLAILFYMDALMKA
jgi:hypothetical protein